MIGGAPLLAMSQQLNAKFHKEYASAMAAEKPYPVAYTSNQGGNWLTPCAVKFSDGSIYDNVIHKWRKANVDVVETWVQTRQGDPLMSNTTKVAGDSLAEEVAALRAKLLDLEMEKRGDLSRGEGDDF